MRPPLLTTLLSVGIVAMTGRADAGGETSNTNAREASGPIVGVGVGRVCTNIDNNCRQKTAWFTVSLRLASARHFAIEPELGYWKWSGPDPSLSEPGEIVTEIVDDILVGCNALILIPGHRTSVFFGPGIGAHFIRDDDSGSVHLRNGTVMTFVPGSPHQNKFGVHILGGLDVNIGRRWQVFGTARVDAVYYKGESGDFPQYLEEKFYFGVRFRLR